MPETLTPARRWNSFVCPGCRLVFRVPEDHDGKGVVCPACRIMLRLPGDADRIPPLLSPARAESADTRDSAPDEDEDEEDEEIASTASGSGDFKFLLSLAVPALVLLGLFAWWISPSPGNPRASAPLQGVSPVEPVAVEIEPAAKNLILQIEEVAKSFLGAETPDEVLHHVRDPEKTAPKLKAWLEGKPYTPPGFREILGDSVTTTGSGGELVTVSVRTGDFEMREIVLFEIGGNLKVDWESWVGWSEMPWDEFQTKRPTDAKWFRVVLSRVEYYNFAFKDENEWVSYRLDSPDGSGSLFGYVPRAGRMDEKIRPVEQDGKVKLLLKLKFPPDPLSGNQVVIEEVSGQGWADLPAPEDP